MMLNISGTELAGFLPSSQGKCLSSPQATSTARSDPYSSSLSSFSASLQITQPAFLKPLYFEVPKTSPSPLVGRSWLFREVKQKLCPPLPLLMFSTLDLH